MENKKDKYIKNESLNNSKNIHSYKRLEDLYNILNKDGYICLGHGTGRSENSNLVVDSIFENGLRTKDNSLYYTTIGLDTSNISKLKEKLTSWQHLSSKKIILIRLPIEYINEIGESADLDGEKYGAFFNEMPSQDGKFTYYLNPKFIIGCYDVESEQVLINDSFEKELSNETIKDLREKLKKALEKTKERFKRQEESLMFTNNSNYNQDNLASQTTDMEWDINDFGDDIEWEQEIVSPKQK